MPAFYEHWPFWLYFAAWVPFMGLTLLYGLGSPWWRSHIGRSLFLVKLSLAAVLTNVLAAFMFPGYAFQNEIRAVLIGLVVVAGWYQLSAFLSVQRQGKSGAPRRRATDRR